MGIYYLKIFSNNITYDSSEKAIKKLVQYQDMKPSKIISVWRAKALEKDNRRNRQDVLKATLDVVEDILKQNYLVSAAEQTVE
jgi:hypothetical protein